MDMYIGKRLDGRYEIETLIGVGGMANVYRAKDLLEDRAVAVKILRDEFLSNEDLVRRFKNESKAISLLSHPNIVRVFDVSVSDKVQYIAMEYIDGVTLKDYIEQRKVLTWKETLHFITQTLEALQGYLDGGYLYIPRRAEHRRAWGERTRRKEETLARNRAIFRDYTAGLGVDELSARYFLAPKSIQRILTLGRRGLLEP